ncbi:hypothetical protein OIU84_011605 [Salix udensis]|uniref:Domain X domain-containing protein n=1 Tax=Salix udensis TaxID=889485 RepID=A0AAD6JN97_9ROSI|nr:hypothetical protein OIU84_011605 [Salix udensis]
MAGFTNKMGRPRPISILTSLEDADIIKWYAGVGRRWLDFFCCCHNLKMVKTVVSYHLRFSCILTLAEKHEATKIECIRHYTKDLKVPDLNGNEEVHFPTEKEVKMMGDKNLSDPKPVDGALSLLLIRLASDEPSHSCIDEDKWVPRMSAIHESLNQMCLPLCSDHKSDLYTGKITLQDVDCTSHDNPFFDSHSIPSLPHIIPPMGALSCKIPLIQSQDAELHGGGVEEVETFFSEIDIRDVVCFDLPSIP